MKCKCRHLMEDLTKGYGEVRNYFCLHCRKWHFYKGEDVWMIGPNYYFKGKITRAFFFAWKNTGKNLKLKASEKTIDYCGNITKEWKVDLRKGVHDQFVQDGYEGAILRNRTGLYEFDHRSENLQKFKQFLDDEAEIIGGKTAETGRFAGSCVFRCRTKAGVEFDCCPRGTMEIRQQYFRDLPKLIGKQLTYRYQNLSDEGTPLFPIGVVIRDYEI